MSITWKIIDNFPIIWYRWGDEVLVYHSGTADTHLLDQVIVKILCSLQNEAQTVKELVDNITMQDDLAGGNDVKSIEDIVKQLHSLDLIEPCL